MGDTEFGFEKWDELKATEKPPFGQLPILETGSKVIGQAIAICNYIGRVGGLEGKDDDEFAVSQMLLAEGEDIYALLQKYQPTKFVKEKAEDNSKLWNELVPGEMKKLERLLSKTEGEGFTSSKATVGELYMFAMMHQMMLVSPEFLKDFPGLAKFYEATKALPAVAKVLGGGSAIGELGQYFISVQ